MLNMSALFHRYSGVFLFGRLTSTQMSLLLVAVEHLFDLVVELSVHLFKLRGYILMHRAFAYSELLCGTAHRGIVFYYVMSEYDTSFLI